MIEWIYEFNCRAKLGTKFVENLDEGDSGHLIILAI